jgi:hypothetical protein
LRKKFRIAASSYVIRRSLHGAGSKPAGPLLAEVFDPADFPIAARVGQAAGQAHQAARNPEHAYAFGLDRLLEGVATLVEERARAAASTLDRLA